MPTGFRRTADTKRLQSRATQLPQGVFPIEEAPRLRRPYGFEEPAVTVEGRIYTADGVFAQVLQPANSLGSVAGDEGGNATMINEPAGGGAPDNAKQQSRDEKKKRQWRKWTNFWLV
ncbi:hypothetical protein CVT26_007775 [Gymnopilus dilepis]|uniref:Uncharacterized protein n=1 Tax=Gymnopilus dilepis TaxID=231916 RepID=A0A409YJY4_9AGAR|nr:hypothetical protein CVT26_007775 [Gymnopilus dilepis]